MVPKADSEAAGRGAEAACAGTCASASTTARSGKPAALRHVLQELVAMGLHRLAGLMRVVELAPGGSTAAAWGGNAGGAGGGGMPPW
jgi:hypothetical protein